MAQCDICNNPGMGSIVNSKEMSSAARKGFNPYKLNILNDMFGGILADDWTQSAISGKLSVSGWNVCDQCMRKLKPYLGSSSGKKEKPSPKIKTQTRGRYR